MGTIATYSTGIDLCATMLRLRHSMTAARGFTLLELVVVLGIALLLTGIALPLLSARMPGAQFDAAVQQLAAHARLARNLAIAGNAPVRLIIDVDARRYQLSEETGNHSLPSTLTLSLYTAESERIGTEIGAIGFYGDGSSTGGRITLSDGKRKRGVDVQWLTGRVSIID